MRTLEDQPEVADRVHAEGPWYGPWLILLACLCLSTLAVAQPLSGNPETGPLASVQSVVPPSNLRVYLLLSPPLDGAAQVRVRLRWNRSTDPNVDGYRITLSSNGRLINDVNGARVSAEVAGTLQYWDSAPIAMTYPPPMAQVQALRGGLLSRPTKREVPLAVKYAALTARPATTTYATLPAATIRALAQDQRNGDIWVGTDGGGLARINPKTREVTVMTELDGLGGNQIYALTFSQFHRDAPGKSASAILWAATEGGLSRLLLPEHGAPEIETFDYREDIYADLLPGAREITVMHEDHAGKIWLGTSAEGLLRFDPQTRVGTRLTTAEGLTNDTVWSITEDIENRRLYLGTNEGLTRLDLDHSRPTPIGDQGLTIWGVARADAERLWLLTPNRILLYHPDTNQLRPRHTFQSRDAPYTKQLIVRDGELWVGTRAGLRRFKTGAKASDFRPIPIAPPPLSQSRLGTSEITALMLSQEGVIWTGFPDGEGVGTLDPQDNHSDLFEGGLVSLHHPVHSLMIDAEGALWIGTDRGPIWMDGRRNLFALYTNQDQKGAWKLMPSAPVLSMVMDRWGNVLLGTRRRGVFRFDAAEGRFKALSERLDPRAPKWSVNAMAVDPNGNHLYLGTEHRGVQAIGLWGGQEYTDLATADGMGLQTGRVLSLLQEGESLWVGSPSGLHRAQLALLNDRPQMSPAQDWPPQDFPGALKLNAVNALARDVLGNLWVGHANGLLRKRPAPSENQSTWTPWLPGSIDSDVHSLAADRFGHLWIGTSRSLYRTLPGGATTQTRSEEPIRVVSDAGRILAITVDDLGVAWIGTSRGLMAVPPFAAQLPPPPSNDRTPLILGLFAALSAFGVWWYRTYRNSVVMAIKNSTEVLTLFKLPELPGVAKALRRAHRLKGVLILLGIDPMQWERAQEVARQWPSRKGPISKHQCDRIVEELMTMLDAEVLELELFRKDPDERAARTRRISTAEMRSANFQVSVPTLQPPPPLPDETLEGFDRGAPGAHEEGVETSQDPVEWNSQGGPGIPIPAVPESETSYSIVKRHPTNAPYRNSHPGKRASLTHTNTTLDMDGPLLYAIRLPELPIRLAWREFPLIVLRKPLPEDFPAAHLSKLLRDYTLPQRYVFVLNLTHLESLPPMSIPATHFVVLNEEEVRQILFSPNPRTGFVRHMIQQIKVTEVSPYSSKGEVSNPHMFVGRRIELDRISSAESANYSLVGARQIGKSSLMGAIRRHFREQSGRQVHAFTLTPQEDARAFYRRFALLLQETRTPRNSQEFAEMMAAHHRQVAPTPVFLIDESDGLLARERAQGYPVLTAMRRLQQEQICTFIIAGYWELYRLGNDYHSPLFNWAETIELGPLKPDEARELLIAPMGRMGLTFQTMGLVDDIIQMTAGHPHLLQFICNQLLECMTAGHPPVFTQKDWHNTRDSDVLKRYVTRNFKSNAGPLDELIVYATVANLRFTHPQLEQALKALGIDLELKYCEESLTKLKLVGIIKEDGGKFEYSLPLFRRMLMKENISYFATAKARELKERLEG